MTTENTKSVIAKSDDGTIQITLTIPYDVIKKEKDKALANLAETTEVPGFRKGKAPIEKVKERINENTLLEKTLSGILPELFAKSVEENKLQPIIYPKFELVKATEGEDWQVRAVTCEAPQVELGDYKTKISGELKSKSIWTPDKQQLEKKGEDTRAEKEHKILKSLLSAVQIKVPKILVDEDVNVRLSSLLSRLEKLGLSLESYLASVGKTAETLRGEYETQSKESLSLDFILNEIAKTEKLSIDEKEIDTAIKAAGDGKDLSENINTPEQRKYIESILKRRKALDSLMTL